jgi:hypothetical protein
MLGASEGEALMTRDGWIDAVLVAALREVGHASGPELVEARQQLHRAAQIVAAVAHTFGTPEADDSHTAFTWHDEGHRLEGAPTSSDPPLRPALSLTGLALRLRSDSGHVRASLDLAGGTVDDAYAWMRARIEERSDARAPGGALVRPVYELPAHPLGEGARFGGVSEPALSEIAHWYQAAAHLLEGVRTSIAGASPVRCWPHHFDIATLVTLGGTGEATRTIGVGMSPGDALIEEPYFYVTPWPYPPPTTTLPALPEGGRWNTTGWTGAVLQSSTLVRKSDDGPARAQALATFVGAAIEDCRRMLEEGRAAR